MTRARLVFSLAFATFGVGCIAFVDQSPTGDQFSTTCALGDSTTACGTCIASSCADQMTACCGDRGCRSVLTDVDECASQGTCVLDETNSAASALGTCIENSCFPTCKAYAGTPTAGAQVSCQAETTSCSCDVGLDIGSDRCDVTTVPNAICCADMQWPSDYTNCNCYEVKCDAYSSGDCMCGTFASGNVACSRAAGYPYCCSDGSSCTCGTSPCNTSEYPVLRCDVADAITCGSGYQQVNNCSSLTH
jgi:hypothetical protein